MVELSKYPSKQELEKVGPQVGHQLILGCGVGGMIDHVNAEEGVVYCGTRKVRANVLEAFITQEDGGAEWKVQDPSAIERLEGPDSKFEMLNRA